MDKNNNKFNKNQNKFSQLPQNNPAFPHGKRPKRNHPMIPYDQSQNPPFIPTEDFSVSPPYTLPGMYQMPTPLMLNKEHFIKNAFKNYLKKPYMQFPQQQEYIPKPENDMSLEDIGNKKFNENKRTKRRKNNYINAPNKDTMIYNPLTDISINNNEINNQNRPSSTENNMIVNNNENAALNEYYHHNKNNHYVPKVGKKKAITVERNNANTNNRIKKNFKKKDKRNNININYKNYKPFYPKKKLYINEEKSINSLSDNDNIESKENNPEFYSSSEEEEKEDNDLDEKDNKSNMDNNNDNNNNTDNDNNNEDDIIILDNSSKEVIDINKIKLVEKKKIPENKIKIIPELDKMCSENEINEREKNKDIDRFEIDSDAFPLKKAKKENMIQKYSWRNGKKLNLDDPKEIRTIKAINESILFLIEKILDCDKVNTINITEGFNITPLDIIPFIYDRFLSIYKTLELLISNDKNIMNDCDLMNNVGKMIRTLIIFINLFLDEYDENRHPIEINKYIDNILLPLLEWFKDIAINEADYEYNLRQENIDEFLSYYLFVKLKKERNNFTKIYHQIKNDLNSHNTYKKIELVNEVYLLLRNKDYQKFINILKIKEDEKNEEKCDYLISCLMSLFFNEINVYGLQKISLKRKELTYKEIKDLLTFEDVDEVKKFLIWYGITKDKSRYIINESDIVPIYVGNQNKKYEYDKAPQKTNIKYIEKKRGGKLRKDIVSVKINFIKNENYKQDNDNNDEINNDMNIKSENNENKDNEIKVVNNILKNKSILNSDLSKDKSSQNPDSINIKDNNSNNNTSNLSINQKDIIINPEISKEIKDTKSPKLDSSFLSKGSFVKLFPPQNEINQNSPKEKSKDINNIFNKSETKILPSDEFLKPYSPKRNSFDSDKNFSNNLSLDKISHISHISISSIEPQKNPPNFNEQTLQFFCDAGNNAINKLISEHKLDFIYRLKFIVEKYKIKLDLIENYINRRKFFVFKELKKCCLDKKYSREYFKELINYNNNLNSENTKENTVFKINNKNLSLNKKFALLTYDDIIYFLIKDYQNINDQERKGYINHLQINIYTTKELIKTTKLLSGLKIKKNLIKENSDGSELSIINNNINLNNNNKISLIIKFIFVDQIIDLDSYIYDNQTSIQKYSILIPFFDIMKSDPQNQQILTKFFTILDLSLGSFIKKEIIFFFIKKDLDENSELYKEYQNIQNEFIFNLTKKYSTNNNKNEIFYVDENYEKNDEIKNKIIYLSPVDEFGKCYQEYIKYLNNKTFVELFEDNKLLQLNAFNPKEVLIPFEKHISNLDPLINYYIATIEEDLKKYMMNNGIIKYFYNKKLCIEILIGFVVCKILLIYYQNKCLSFSNELYKIPYENSNSELLILEDNLLNAGGILRQINLEGYDYIWKKCKDVDNDIDNNNKDKNMLYYFDIFSEMICSYNLISDIDIQNYEFNFRKQYYDINIEKKEYEISKNFVNFFNKIISKFVQNNNLRIKIDMTSEILKKIYDKNKKFLIEIISKIITNNNSLIFNENLIYIKGIENFNNGVRETHLSELNNNLNKKRKRKPVIINHIKNNNKILNINNFINKYQNLNENYNNRISNDVININESVDKSKSIKSISFNDKGDVSDEYYKYFRNVKKCKLPDGLI